MALRVVVPAVLGRVIEPSSTDAAPSLGNSPGRPVTREVLEAAARLRVGASPIIGTEMIDVEAATELGIVIGYGAAPENLPRGARGGGEVGRGGWGGRGGTFV